MNPIYPTRDGDLEILEYISTGFVIVRFIDTGFITHTRMSQIRRGSVKDRLLSELKRRKELSSKLKYLVTLHDGSVFEARTYNEVAQRAGVSQDMVASVSTRGQRSSIIKSIEKVNYGTL